MQLRNEELVKIIQEVNEKIVRFKPAYILPEHIVEPLFNHKKFIEIVNYCGGNLDSIRLIIDKTVKEQEQVSTDEEVIPTDGYTKIINDCRNIANEKKSDLNLEVLLISLLRNGEGSPAHYALASNGITEEKIEEYFGYNSKKKGLNWVVDLNEKAKKEPFPVIGRELELERLIQILHKKRSSNALIIGNTGVGKTALVEALAQKITEGNVPESMKNQRVWVLDLSSMIAGTKFRGEFEERLKYSIEKITESKDIILFIDEIHTIIGAGGSAEGAIDASNILKPYLSGGALRCIGATTHEEYKKHILKDKAFARRFKKLDLKEPSKSETIGILKGLRDSYEKFHGIKYSDEIINYIVELSSSYIIEQYFPDKAIEVMDEIGSVYRSRLNSGSEATVEDVERVVSKIANIPSITAKKEEKDVLRNLSDEIKKEIFGQDESVEKVVRHVKLAKAGLTNKNKPLYVGLMIGSSGTGKTEFAKQLASKMGVSFLKLDMSEYSEKNSVSKLIGTSPGYIGFDQAGSLTEPLIRNPHCVILLDEIEKADSSVYDLLLQVMDEGKLTDNNNREATFRNSIIFMTSNVGCAAADNVGELIGFQGGSKKESIIDSELKRKFSPEFRNRFTEILKFNNLGVETISMIVEKEIRKVNEFLCEKEISVFLEESGKNFIVNKAMEENMGGRPVERLVQRFISEKIVDSILFEDLKKAKLTFSESGQDLKFIAE